MLRRAGKVVLSLVSVIVVTLTWYGWQFIGGINEGVATTDVFAQGLPAKPLDGAIDILLVGQDSRTDAQGNPLPREVLDMLSAGEADGERQTDTMILVHIPQNGKQAVAISFPRDSWVEFAGDYGGKHKLNGAFVYAYNDMSKTLQEQGNTDMADVDEQSKIAGRKELIATVEKFIGKPGMIDRYAEVNLSSFYEVTKSIGGIEICLNNAVREKRSGVDLPAGNQTVEGVQALGFVRQRYDLPNGDLDRIARQQAFLSGLARKVLSPDVLTSPSNISDLIGAVKKSVVLSKDWDLIEFVDQMRGLTGGNIQFRTIPTLGNASIGGADVMEVDPEAVQGFVDELTADADAQKPPPAPATTTSGPPAIPGADQVTVDVFDGSGTDSTGTSTQNTLTDKGFRPGEQVTLDARDSTVVRYAPGGEAALELLQQALGRTFTAEPDSDVEPGRLRVLLGQDLADPAAGSSPGGGPAEPGSAEPEAGEQDSSEPGGGAAAEPEEPPITAAGVPCVN
ncbi:LytTR family transcriptional regulator [Amycolatopsis antarctica]|uniref:LytTR family transcriptional regulator n=1 Tax=Amycolatopsis antarctica TaxID=1854586 RepID=A0A263DCW0_9PSEU|nr:LCP family protein [Amycolatopsis antarctica]OZM75326.1 LytTR family transcriptional regulator [Amycolatopsis antarctica]